MVDPILGLETPQSRLDIKFTLDEYLFEMNNREQVLMQQPDRSDVDDPLYCRKFAHNMPPLAAYRCRPVNWDRVNVQGDDNRRAVFYGWNNVTQHEREGMNRAIEWLRKEKQVEVPEGFGERNLLKFV